MSENNNSYAQRIIAEANPNVSIWEYYLFIAKQILENSNDRKNAEGLDIRDIINSFRLGDAKQLKRIFSNTIPVSPKEEGQIDDAIFRLNLGINGNRYRDLLTATDVPLTLDLLAKMYTSYKLAVYELTSDFDKHRPDFEGIRKEVNGEEAKARFKVDGLELSSAIEVILQKPIQRDRPDRTPYAAQFGQFYNLFEVYNRHVREIGSAIANGRSDDILLHLDSIKDAYLNGEIVLREMQGLDLGNDFNYEKEFSRFAQTPDQLLSQIKQDLPRIYQQQVKLLMDALEHDDANLSVELFQKLQGIYICAKTIFSNSGASFDEVLNENKIVTPDKFAVHAYRDTCNQITASLARNESRQVKLWMDHLELIYGVLAGKKPEEFDAYLQKEKLPSIAHLQLLVNLKGQCIDSITDYMRPPLEHINSHLVSPAFAKDHAAHSILARIKSCNTAQDLLKEIKTLRKTAASNAKIQQWLGNGTDGGMIAQVAEACSASSSLAPGKTNPLDRMKSVAKRFSKKL